MRTSKSVPLKTRHKKLQNEQSLSKQDGTQAPNPHGTLPATSSNVQESNKRPFAPRVHKRTCAATVISTNRASRGSCTKTASHRDVDEVAGAVRTDEQRLIHHHRPSEHRPANHDPHAPHLVDAVDGEVDYWQLRLRDLKKQNRRRTRSEE